MARTMTVGGSGEVDRFRADARLGVPTLILRHNADFTAAFPYGRLVEVSGPKKFLLAHLRRHAQTVSVVVFVNPPNDLLVADLVGLSIPRMAVVFDR